MDNKTLSAQVEKWISEMRHVASERPATGACAIASAMELWLWTLEDVQKSAEGDDPSIQQRESQTLADALCILLAARSMVLSSWDKGPADDDGASPADSPLDADTFYTNLCHAQSAHAAGEVGRMCAEVVFGRRFHPTWDPSCEACVRAEDVDTLEGIMPGISYGARLAGDVLETDGSHAEKAGPCVRLDGLQGFVNRRAKLDGCMSGAYLSRDRAAQLLAGMIF